MRKIAAVMMFAALGLTLPVAAIAQSHTDDAARIASQKRNERRSRQEVRQRKHALNKAIRAAGKPKQPRTRTSQTLN